MPNLPRPTVELVPAKPGVPSGGGELTLLVSVAVEHPAVSVERPPLDLALVIDRSGSMSGQPLAAAKRAAQLALSMLLPDDRVAVVAFDDQVRVVQALTKVGADRRAIRAAIGSIEAGGSTDLFGGWAEGLSQVMSGSAQPGTVQRVVLLSDGHANAGVTDRAAIAHDVTAAAGHGVTTTAMGLGRHYDEHLLRLIADSGSGNYVFLEDEAAIARAFEVEVAGLSSLRGQGVTLSATGPAGATLAHADQHGARDAGLGAGGPGCVPLPDLIAGLPGDYLLRLSLPPTVGEVELVLRWHDVLTGAEDQLTLTLTLPTMSASGWVAAPVDPRVKAAEALVEVARLKRDLAAAANRGESGLTESLLEQLTNAISTLPEGEERLREEAELVDLRRNVANFEYAVAAKRAAFLAQRNARSISEEKLEAMRRAEMQWRDKQREFAAAHGQQHAPSALRGTPRQARHRTDEGNEVLFEATLPDTAQRVQVVRGDITRQAVDAVVNSTSRSLIGAAGVDGALARAGGPRHLAAMRDIGGMEYGQAVFTPAFGIPARYVIHTAAQRWSGGGDELNVLRRCYEAVFALADSLSVRSLAVPAIGTGNYGFPTNVAADIAVEAAKRWTQRSSVQLLRFVVFDAATGADYVRKVENW